MRPEGDTAANAGLRARLAALVGPTHLIDDAASMAAYAIDERALFEGRPLAVVRPASTGEVAAVVAACRDAGAGIVPQGGNTGYCGGATPDRSGTQIVVSLGRMNRIQGVDPIGASMTVEAGVTLAEAQAAAARAGLLFPLSMGSQSSCQIGGNLSTNAGGLAVLRYGTARQLTLGLEVVLPDGQVLDLLRALRKDTTGYDLKHLFIGAEGTLGIITRATLALFPPVTRETTVFAAVPDIAAACTLLGVLRAAVGDNVTSFEYLSAAALGFVTEAFPDLRAPLGTGHAHFVLAECAEYGCADSAEQRPSAALEAALASAVDDGLVEDAVVAQSDTQHRALWQLRERVPAAEKTLGGSIKHDISVALGDLPACVEQASAALHAQWPALRLSVYGHLGDGNLHFNVLAPMGEDAAAFKSAHGAAVSEQVHDIAYALHGSFSAEHGVGQLKRDLLARHGGSLRVAMMRTLKETLDPDNLMNPGKLFL
ncbi:MAG: FAD-binding oxidoreductase [Gammaproteobacteria bacterium]